MQQESNTGIVRNLFIVFFISTLLLLISIIGSVTCINELIDSSQWVSHTNEVLFETEGLISGIKDAETAQRGYVITGRADYLELYNPSYIQVKANLSKIKFLTSDNLSQQDRIAVLTPLIEERFQQMDRVLELYGKAVSDKAAIDDEMQRGRQIMMRVRAMVDEMKGEENRLLLIRTKKLEVYVKYTPVLIIAAALLSIAITIISFVRIKKETEDRLKKQHEDELLYRETSERITQMEIITQRISAGDLYARAEEDKKDEIGRVAGAVNKMTASLQKSFHELENKSWLESKAVEINDAIRGRNIVAAFGTAFMEKMNEIVNYQVGAMYIRNNADEFILAAQHASVNAPARLTEGQGLTGQALTKNSITSIDGLPLSHLKLQSSVGESDKGSLLIVPFYYNNEAIGIMELGFTKPADGLKLQLIENSRESVSIGINSVLNYQKLQEFLEETQAQAEELQAQHNELENMNTELESQAHKLQISEEELKVQQEELMQTNAELEERSNLLIEKNTEIELKAKELALTTKYKSEFLANMSHELRTPLNSILLLSRLLSDNNHKHLDKEEVEYAKVIQTSGKGLLDLINEILDLSKIETGKIDLDYEETRISEVLNGMKALFGEVAKDKHIEFNVQSAEDIPASIDTDRMRLEQILKNLISNAIKFTAKGSVHLDVMRCLKNNNYLCFTVKDTGIGIPKDKHALVFEAFQQADGSTKRKYGGTGLGLSISKQLAKLLQGEITLNSEVDQGSEFTVYIPIRRATADPAISKLEQKVLPPEPVNTGPAVDQYISPTIPEALSDDRSHFKSGDTCILIVEDDINFAKSLLEFARKRGYKGIVSVRGDEAVELAKTYSPKGILLDIQLPVKSGWEVMDELKKNPLTKSIPVHIMSSHHVKQRSLLKGAVDFIDKPVAFEQMQDVFRKIEHVLAKSPKKVLIVEDNSKHAHALAYFLETYQINSEVKNNISESMKALKSQDIDCVILDMGIPANNAYDLLEEFKKDTDLEKMPIIIFTGKSLSVAEEQRIKKYADVIVVKTAHSYQRMLDEVSLFLHVVEDKKAPPPAFKKLGTLDQVLKGKTVLITDDDVRNIFSLTKALEGLSLNVLTAINGKEALQRLNENPSIDVVLLDIMMPEMDGYETARRIRENPHWKNLPVIAVTAKAMTGDREKCIKAGASDYISKPIDIDQLLSLLRVWLYDSLK